MFMLFTNIDILQPYPYKHIKYHETMNMLGPYKLNIIYTNNNIDSGD